MNEPRQSPAGHALAGFPPKAYLIGAQKAGTTFLASLLAQHPRVMLSEPKEAAFYTRHWERGLDWYRSCFADTRDRVLLDATPAYSMSPLPRDDGMEPPASRFAGVPERIHSVSPEARFIYVLRDPVERTYSAYWHNVRAGVERLPFREALRRDPGYLAASRYDLQIRRYLDCFPHSSLLILLFEELRNDPSAAVADCCAFLELDSFEPVMQDASRNRSVVLGTGLRWLDHALAPVGGLKHINRHLKPWLPAAVRDGLRRALTRPVPPLDDADREYLQAYFAPGNETLARLLTVDPRRIWGY